jgi:hypothetical protein
MEYSTFKTENGNHHLYSVKKNRFLYLHPILAFLISLKQKKIVVADYIRSVNRTMIYIDGYGNCSKKEMQYYYNKLLFLKSKDFFDPVGNEERINYRIDAQDIKIALANSTHCIFEVTEKCNLFCDYCTYGKLYVIMTPEIKMIWMLMLQNSF